MVLFLGLLFIVGAIATFLWEGRRRFYRRNAAGNETFKSFGESIATRALEKVVGAVGILLFVLGVLLVLFSFSPHQ